MTSCHREQEEAFAKGELRRKRNSCGVQEVMAVPTLNLMCHFSRTCSFFFTALTVVLKRRGTVQRALWVKSRVGHFRCSL